MGARCIVSALALVAGAFIWAFAASTASAAGCAHPAVIGGKVVCLRVGARCQTSNATAYANADLTCARTRRGRRLRAASLAVQRHGRALALGSSGRPTYQQSLWDFSHTLGGLPGVHVPRGAVGSQTDGTSALKDVLGYENRLSKAQRAAVDAVLNAPGEIVATADPSSPVAPAARSAAIPSDIQADLTEAISRLRAHGVKLVHPIQVKALKTNDGTEEAHTVAGWLYKGRACVISFRPSGLAASRVDRRVVLVHELMHCASGELVSNARAWEAQPKFLDEGLPEWAAFQVGIEWQGSIGTQGWWSTYLGDPRLSLFGRSYDAVGFWALVKHEGADPFALFPSLVAAGSSGDAHAVYQVARNAGGGDALVADWGPTLAGHADFGPRWALGGPGQPKRSEPDKGTITESSKPAVGGALEAGADEFKVDLEAEIVKVQGPKDGQGFLRDSSGQDHPLASGTTEYCTEDTGCFCPDGSELPYPILPKGESYVGFATEANVDTVGVGGQSVDNDPGCKGKGRQGIQVLGQNNAVLAVFGKGTCSLKAGTFTAHATDSGYTLDVKVSGASYGHVYDLAYGGSNPTFTIKGRGGPFSNINTPPDTPPFGGGIGLAKKGSAMTLGFVEAFNAGISDGVAVGGGYMSCRAPKQK